MKQSRVYAYLRASTKEQDAQRARQQLEKFALDSGMTIAAWFVENESGAKLERPELFRLLDVAQAGDVLLIEQVDRLSRLDAKDWQKLRGTIDAKQIRLVALDLPTSHQLMQNSDEFTGRMMQAISGMLLDMLAAVARKDYEDRRRRQAQGIAKNKHKFKGRPANKDRHERIRRLLGTGKSYREIAAVVDASISTISRVANSSKSATT